MNSRGSSMTMMIGIVLIAVILALAGLWAYNKRESNDYATTWEAIHKANSNYNEANIKFDANIKSMNEAREEINSLKKLIESMNKTCESTYSENIAIMKKCADLEQKQIQLQDQLSKKRPVIQLRQPVSVEVVTPARGINSLIKQSGKKAKELGQ